MSVSSSPTRPSWCIRTCVLGLSILLGGFGLLAEEASSAASSPSPDTVVAAAPTPVRTATPVRTVAPVRTATPAPTATPTVTASFAYYWVENHRLTDLWNGPASQPGATSLGTTEAQYCAFQVLDPQTDARLHVFNPARQEEVWVDAQDVGVAAVPERRVGPAPDGVNCTPYAFEPQGAPLDQRLVVALYYAWFDQATWTSGMTADLPMIPSWSDDPAGIQRQVGLAKEAGIDVLAQAWYGPMKNNPTERNFQSLLSSAERAGMRAALLLETDSVDWFPDRAAMVAALKHFLHIHAEHPAYLRVDGRPVILVWHPYTAFGEDGNRVNDKSRAAIDAWAALIRDADPERRALWIAEGDYFPLLEVFDGIFPYSIAWSPDPSKQLRSYSEKVRAFNTTNGARKLWAATAMPGYDDRLIPGRSDAFAVDRADGGYYRATFRGAIQSEPTWVMITSWNEWLEGTQIEPARGYGTRYLEITREMARAFKGRA